MAVTEAVTVADVDEALAHLSAGLYAAQCTGNNRAELTWNYIDRLLDHRNELARDQDA